MLGPRCHELLAPVVSHRSQVLQRLLARMESGERRQLVTALGPLLVVAAEYDRHPPLLP